MTSADATSRKHVVQFPTAPSADFLTLRTWGQIGLNMAAFTRSIYKLAFLTIPNSLLHWLEKRVSSWTEISSHGTPAVSYCLSSVL